MSFNSTVGSVLCPGCAVEGPLKRDKYKRPYWRCYLCGLSIFLRTDGAEAGFWLMQTIIKKNPKAYRAAALRIAQKGLKERRLAASAPPKPTSTPI